MGPQEPFARERVCCPRSPECHSFSAGAKSRAAAPSAHGSGRPKVGAPDTPELSHCTKGTAACQPLTLSHPSVPPLKGSREGPVFPPHCRTPPTSLGCPQSPAISSPPALALLLPHLSLNLSSEPCPRGPWKLAHTCPVLFPSVHRLSPGPPLRPCHALPGPLMSPLASQAAAAVVCFWKASLLGCSARACRGLHPDSLQREQGLSWAALSGLALDT